MPKDGDPLPAANIALIRAWIEQGAVWPDSGADARATKADPEAPSHWAYRPPARPPLPPVPASAATGRERRSIDSCWRVWTRKPQPLPEATSKRWCAGSRWI